MGLIRCKKCGKEISDSSDFCQFCGERVMREDTNTEIGAEINKKEKKTNKVLIIVLACVAIIIIAIVAILLLTKTSRTIKSAKELIAEEEYVAAVEMLTALNKPDECSDLLDKAYKKMGNEIEDLIEEKEFDDATDLLEKYSIIPNYDELAAEIEEAICEETENEIYDLMEKGEYVKAQKELDKHKDLASYQEIADKIEYESIGLKCILNLKPHMKNPKSLQMNSIKFYQSSDDTAYPIVVICESGQNGLGGTSSSYSLYSGEDQSITGTCNTLDEDDYDKDDYDDLAALLICTMINLLPDEDLIETNCDLGRMNRILSNDITPDIDLLPYAKSSDI